jgi:hypothetical protein
MGGAFEIRTAWEWSQESASRANSLRKRTEL